MKFKKQKNIFLDGEGDAFFQRNICKSRLSNKDFDDDYVTKAIKKCMKFQPKNNTKLLEVGSSNGNRLRWLKDKFDIDVCGLDPSLAACNHGRKNNLHIEHATADSMPYADKSFDIVVFGFCLYLCDRDDLFIIAHEANRVLKNEGWIIIEDFHTNVNTSNEYKHNEGVQTSKMDNSTIFSWHPNYMLFFQEIYEHEINDDINDQNNWVATSILRKLPRINTYEI